MEHSRPSIPNTSPDGQASSTQALLTAALAYAQRGWHVFPLHTPMADGCSCGKPTCGDQAGKHPRYHDADLAHGHNSATRDPDLIERWWTRWPEANLGVVTGQVSGFVVIDIDPRNGGQLTRDDLEAEHGKFPPTVESLTGGGGQHLLYQHPGGTLRCGTEVLGPGLDIKADGGYIVAPPSLHASGRRYEWEVSSHPDDVPCAALPAWIPLEDETEEDPETGQRRSLDDYTGDRLGDAYNRRITRAEVRLLLTGHGWTVIEHRNDVDYLRRPGKTRGMYSASLGYLRGNRLKVFSTSDPILRPKKGGYQPFALYALLEHAGDFRAATKALRHLGYGGNGPSHGSARDASHTSPNGDETPSAEPQKPIIQISTDMPVVVDQLEHAIRTMPKAPHVFQRERKLSVITQEVKPPEWLHRSMDAPAICPIEAPYLRELASKAAVWERYDNRKKDGQQWVKTLPPEWAIRSLMARPYSRFPVLEGLIFAPTIRPDGSILETTGYDANTGLYACFRYKSFPPIPQQPTADDAREAMDALKDPFVDFMFAKDCHRVATIAAICTIVCRFAVQGPVPLIGVSATAPGSGKGLLIDTITMSAIGRTAPRWAQTADHEEERKRLFAIAVEGDPVVHIDNVIHPLGSAALDMVMTAQMVKERKMKTLTNESARIYAVLFASGNNLTYKQTLSRRVVPIDLDPGVERPEERANFTYNPLLPYISQRWQTLAVHALTIIRAFFVAKQPKQHLTPLGSFESWSTTIREALVWAGEVDPCEGRKHMRAESDLDLEALQTLMNCWHECYEDRSVDAKKVAQDLKLYTQESGIVKWCDLQEAIRTFSARSADRQLTSLQIAIVLRTYKGRIVYGRRFIRVGGTETHAGEWKLETCEPIDR